jgi:hypothetical protein
MMSESRNLVRKTALTSAEGFWYVVQCIAFGMGYFYKIPTKKAFEDFGMGRLTSAEHFWYVMMNIGFGHAYFLKVISSKAISELPQYTQARKAALASGPALEIRDMTELSTGR